MYGFFTLNDQCKVTKLLNVITASSMADEGEFFKLFLCTITKVHWNLYEIVQISYKFIEIHARLFRYHASLLKSMQIVKTLRKFIEFMQESVQFSNFWLIHNFFIFFPVVSALTFLVILRPFISNHCHFFDQFRWNLQRSLKKVNLEFHFCNF